MPSLYPPRGVPPYVSPLCNPPRATPTPMGRYLTTQFGVKKFSQKKFRCQTRLVYPAGVANKSGHVTSSTQASPPCNTTANRNSGKGRPPAYMAYEKIFSQKFFTPGKLASKLWNLMMYGPVICGAHNFITPIPKTVVRRCICPSEKNFPYKFGHKKNWL